MRGDVTDDTNSAAKAVENCRLCGSGDLEVVLDLGSTPLANDFRPIAIGDCSYNMYPLEILQCRRCSHAQLGTTISPEILFRNYSYVSGTSITFKKHFEDFAKWMRDSLNLDPKYSVLEIGSNDGTFLRQLQTVGFSVFGVEPAENIFESLEPKMQDLTYPGFFDKSLVEKLQSESKLFSAIVANNVFAHIPDLRTTVELCHELLVEDGYLIFEVSHLLRVIEDGLFDTIYHEHLDYHSVNSLNRFLRTSKFQIVTVMEVQTHGGSIRIVAKKVPSHTSNGDCASVERIVTRELKAGLDSPRAFHALTERISELKMSNRNILDNLIQNGNRIACFGAPAKLTTLSHVFEIQKGYFEFAVDDSPLKQGTWVPGGHFPVISRQAALEQRVSVYFISAWNFAHSIIKSFADNNLTFLIPLPKSEIVRGIR